MSRNSRNFIRALHLFDAVVQRTGADQWEAPTACEGWSARDLIEHQCAVINGVTAVANSGEMARPTPPEDMSDPKAAWNQTLSDAMAALDRQGVLQQTGPFWFDAPTVDDMVGIVMWDPLTHTWDLASGVGQDPCLPDDLLQAAYDTIAPMSDLMVESGRTAAPVHVAQDASLTERYLALVGRQA